MKQSFYEDKEVFSKYIKGVEKYSVLSPEEQLDLIKKAQAGNEKARNTLISTNFRFVMEVVKQFKYNGLSMQELISEGNLGLFEAIEKFDTKRKNNFISYAVWWIKHYIMRAIRESGNIIRMPANKTRELIQLKKIEEQNYYDNIIDEHKNIEKIKDVMNISEKRVLQLKQISKDVLSLNSVVELGEEGKVVKEDILEDTNAEDPRNFTINIEEIETIEYCLKRIPKREAGILRKRYGLNGENPQSLEDISKQYNVTKERIRQIEILGISRIKSMVHNMGMLDAA